MAVRTTTGVLPAAKALLLVLVALVAAHAQVDDAADPIDIMKRGLQTSSAGSFCSTSATDCLTDGSCLDCFTALSQGYSSCDATDITNSCSDVSDYYCCALEAEGDECKDNSAFANYFGGCMLIGALVHAELVRPFCGSGRFSGQEDRSSAGGHGDSIVHDAEPIAAFPCLLLGG